MKTTLHIIRILCFGTLLFMTMACNDWLDVKSETEAKEEDLFDKVSGFKAALTGLYMDLADVDAYGERLTMTDIEELACMWYCDGYDYNPDYYYLHKHEYSNDYAKDDVKSIYQQMFNIITQVNVLLMNIKDNSAALDDDPQLKQLITGEAYAIRALCQFDVLRIFGQLPQGLGSRNVKLPYSFTTNINEIPHYYSYNDYVELLMSDIENALKYLKESDPVMDYPLEQLNSTYYVNFDDDFYYYRRMRLNYWAVKALKARMDMYLGNEDMAHDEAVEVITATTSSGSAVVQLGADDNLASNYNTLPTEHLFALSKYDVFSYTNTLLLGSSGAQVTPNRHLVLSMDMLNQLFQGTDLSANNRYLNLWYRKSANSQGVNFATLNKYYFNTSNGSASMVYQSIIPMIRLSEMYLIAMETANDVGEANTWYTTYMRDHKIIPAENFFTTMEEVKAEVINEYRREFFAEGQMFYVYKRKFITEMLWSDNTMSENDYIVPLPDTEYEN